MTKLELARIVADDFREAMKQEGFKTFAEMKKCYMWETADIKEEFRAVLESAGNYDMFDDDTFDCKEGIVSYVDFKNCVMLILKCTKDAEEFLINLANKSAEEGSMSSSYVLKEYLTQIAEGEAEWLVRYALDIGMKIPRTLKKYVQKADMLYGEEK